MVYILTFVFLASLAFAYDFGGLVAGKRFNYWVALTLLVLIAGFRYKIGGDTQNYMNYYQFTPNLSGILKYSGASEKIQPLWLIFASAAKTISSSFYALQVLQALVVNISVFVFFKNTTKYYFTAILIYSIGGYPLFNFEIMREAMAVSFFLFAYPPYRDGRWKAFYFFVTLAFLFHASAIFLFFLPLLRWRQPPVILAPVVFLVGVLLGPILREFLGDGQSLSWILDYASTYTDYTATTHGLIALFTLFVLFPIFLIHTSGIAGERDSPIRALMITGVWVGASTSLFFIFFRFINYFTPIYIVVAGMAVHRVYRMRGTRTLRGLLAITLLLIVFTFYSFRYFSDTSSLVKGTRWYSRWYPYYSILDERVDPSREAVFRTSQ